MKKAAIIGLLMLGFIFQNCKNNKTQKDVLKHDDTETVVQQELDTTEVFENPETDKEVSASIEIEEITEPIKTPKTNVSTKWDIPEKYMKMKNPTYANQENLAIGEALYAKHCKSCHGKTGKGDGPKAGEFDSNIGDFSSKEFHEQTEGEIFYKSYIGRSDMPNYEKKIPNPEDMWFIVNHLKTLEEYLKTMEN